MKEIKKNISSPGGRAVFLTYTGFVINSVYGIGHGVLGFISHSLWLVTLSAYYLTLSIMRFSVILYSRKKAFAENGGKTRIQHFSGAMFLFLEIILLGTLYLTLSQNVGTKYHEIIMITVALYSFSKITLAVMNLCKSKKHMTPALKVIRYISLADASVSVFSLQRSMLVSFGTMPHDKVLLLNFLTGSAICLLVLVLGIRLLRSKNNI